MIWFQERVYFCSSGFALSNDVVKTLAEIFYDWGVSCSSSD